MISELIEGARRNPIWFGSIGAITLVQGWLGWAFWGAFTEAPVEQAGLRAVGLAFVGGEVVALDMASRAALRDEKARAHTLRAMWVSLAVLNLAVDVNALSRVLQTVEHSRAEDMAAYQAREARIQELRGLIDAADDPFPDGRLLTPEAYDAALASKDREIALAQLAPLWRQRRLERERGDIEVAWRMALQVAAWRTELDQMTTTPADAAPPPRTGALEFAPLAGALTAASQGVERAFGAEHPSSTITPEQVRGAVAIVASIAMKVMLTLGVWAGLERRRPTETTPLQQSHEPSVAHTRPPPPRPQARRGSAVARFGRFGRRFG